MPAERRGGDAALPAAWARAHGNMHTHTPAIPAPPLQCRAETHQASWKTPLPLTPGLSLTHSCSFQHVSALGTLVMFQCPLSVSVPQCHCLGSMYVLLWVHMAVPMLALPPVTGQLLQSPRDAQQRHCNPEKRVGLMELN